MRWWCLLLLMACYSNNWTEAAGPELTPAWAKMDLPTAKGTVVMVEADALVIDFRDGGSSYRQALYKKWHQSLQKEGWKPVETYGDLSTGSVKRANYYNVDGDRHAFMEVIRKPHAMRVQIRKTTVRTEWEAG